MCAAKACVAHGGACKHHNRLIALLITLMLTQLSCACKLYTNHCRADGKSASWYLPFIAAWSGGNRGSEKPIYSDGSFGMYTMPDVTQE